MGHPSNLEPRTSPLEFIAIGDTVVDEFINLKDAHVSCDVNNQNCTISMRWGDKIPYDSSVSVPAVGNAANAAVCAARLGLSSGFISNVGKDSFGEEILATFEREGVNTEYIAMNANIPTNHHYVLSYESERTILIKHEKYPYIIPEELIPPKWMYLSSIGEHSETFHNDLAKWLIEHPETKLAFQPGTLQIKMGVEKLSEIYAAAEIVAVNKEEAESILGLSQTDIKDLLREISSLGPKVVLITDGLKGAYAFDGTEIYTVPMYPDPKPPVDRTGAGDAMTSTFVIALSLGKNMREALLWGPINSMSVVQHIGAQKGLLARKDIERHIAEAPETYTVTAL
ncbi:MAG: carbohydrate kinase family protein [bacterium]|nr:carbohydrate kinase family protein [bacterium]